ncbi:MAG: Lrp/AsnC family transcriptional regulator [Armatimonadetes bacterium]|nr:Lrp/AsnC family transcriptional regulator [Armatimonadota bacterium]
MAFDATDIRILETLQEEGRITNADLAARIGLTPGPVLARVNKLESAGVIKNYAAIVDRDAAGLPFTAFVSVIMRANGRVVEQNFLNAIQGIPEVLECHHIAGDEDYLLKVVAENARHYELHVLERILEIQDVQRVKSIIVLSSPKTETKVPIRGQLLGARQ